MNELGLLSVFLQPALYTAIIFAALFLLILLKYFTLKKALKRTVKEEKERHITEINHLKEQLYTDLQQEFKAPLENLTYTLEEIYKKEKEGEKKKVLRLSLRKTKIIAYKLNQWSEDSDGPEETDLPEEMKKEFYMEEGDKYPVHETQSVKTVLENEQLPNGLEIVKNYLANNLASETFNLKLSGAEEKLLKNIIEYIRENLENTELSVEGMSKHLGLSRNHLHRKLKAMTGQSPVEFIKTIRMSYAAHLLSIGKWSVSEVGYKVGYNTPSYFSSSFTSHFGMSPSSYIGKQKKKHSADQLLVQ
ncbi:MAG: AraC family transcriptional regulator [Tannerellaceae bacterium]|nr:AraC family transcriptional regulator [Tannerellaceae bacterium]